MIFYDQIGVGRSTHLPHKPSSFWTVELFMDKLDNVLSHFGLGSKSIKEFMLLGHSWGGMLASDYVATRQPKNLKRLVLASAPASMELWEVAMKQLLARLPKEVQEVVKKHEENGTTDSEEYQDAMMEFHGKHICTIDPWPKHPQDAFAPGDGGRQHRVQHDVSPNTRQSHSLPYSSLNYLLCSSGLARLNLTSQAL